MPGATVIPILAAGWHHAAMAVMSLFSTSAWWSGSRRAVMFRIMITQPLIHPGEPQAPAADPSQYIFGVTQATPQADGTIKHKVLYGQTLITIAEAYGTTVNELRTLNKMDATNTVIWPDQELLIKTGTGAAGFTGSGIAHTQTTAASTAVTTAPTSAPQPTLQPTSTLASEPTRIPTQPAVTEKRADPKLGLMLLGISALVLVILLFISPARK